MARLPCPHDLRARIFASAWAGAAWASLDVDVERTREQGRPWHARGGGVERAAMDAGEVLCRQDVRHRDLRTVHAARERRRRNRQGYRHDGAATVARRWTLPRGDVRLARVPVRGRRHTSGYDGNATREGIMFRTRRDGFDIISRRFSAILAVSLVTTIAVAGCSSDDKTKSPSDCDALANEIQTAAAKDGLPSTASARIRLLRYSSVTGRRDADADEGVK